MQSSHLHRASGKNFLTRHYYLVFFLSECAKVFAWKGTATSSCGYLKLASTRFVPLGLKPTTRVTYHISICIYYQPSVIQCSQIYLLLTIGFFFTFRMTRLAFLHVFHIIMHYYHIIMYFILHALSYLFLPQLFKEKFPVHPFPFSYVPHGAPLYVYNKTLQCFFLFHRASH